MKHIDFFQKYYQMPSEQVFDVIDGWIGEVMGKGPMHIGVLILSDKRVSFVRNGFIGSVFQSIALDRISSVEYRSKFGHSMVTFHTSHDDLTFKSSSYADLQRLLRSFEDIRQNVARGRGGGVSGGKVGELEQLLALRESGELSPDEYAAAKAHLLKHGTLFENATSHEVDSVVRHDARDRGGVVSGRRYTATRQRGGASWLSRVAVVTCLVIAGFYFTNAPVDKVEAGPGGLAKEPETAPLEKQVADTADSPPPVIAPVTVADAAPTTSVVCKAAIAAIMGRDPATISTKPLDTGTVGLSYIRPSDGTVWSYRCKLDGDRVIWASDTGRWRTHANDEKILFKASGTTLTISQVFLDGSTVEDDYSLSEL